MRSNLRVLVAQKAQRERRRISLRTVIEETGVNKHTIYGMASDTLREYPADALAKLCDYFECDLGTLLFVEDVPQETQA